MTPCPGSCNAWWRALTHAQQEASETPPRHGEPTWCTQCATRIRYTLGDLETLAALLEHASDGYGEATDQPGHSHHAHSPSPSPGFDALDEIERMVMDWEREYWRIKDWGSPPRHGRYATVCTEVVVWLMRHLDSVLESPFAQEFGEEVLDASRQLVRKAKAGSNYKRGVPPCPRCELKMLGSSDGGLVFWCAHCGRPVRKDEYDELCRAATTRAAS